MSSPATALFASLEGGDDKDQEGVGESTEGIQAASLATLPEELLLAILEEVNAKAPFEYKGGLEDKGGLSRLAVNKRVYDLARIVRFRHFPSYSQTVPQSHFFSGLLFHSSELPLIHEVKFAFEETVAMYDCALMRLMPNLEHLDLYHSGTDLLPTSFTITLSQLPRLTSLTVGIDYFTLEDEAFSLSQLPHLYSFATDGGSRCAVCPGLTQLLRAANLTVLELYIEGFSADIYRAIPWRSLKRLVLWEGSAPNEAVSLVQTLKQALDEAGALPLLSLKIGPCLLTDKGEFYGPGKDGLGVTLCDGPMLKQLLSLLSRLNLSVLHLGGGSGVEWKESAAFTLPITHFVFEGETNTSILMSVTATALCTFLRLFPNLSSIDFRKVHFRIRTKERGEDERGSVSTLAPEAFNRIFKHLVSLLVFLRDSTKVLHVRCEEISYKEECAFEWIRGAADEDFERVVKRPF
ncbi:hypothetical protein JCM6882_000425 [Rhodosporidiobolus microsporus]